MSVKSGNIKSHPLFALLAATMGEKESHEVIRQLEEKKRLENQTEASFSIETKKIIIPATMNKLEAARDLERQWNDEETVIDVDRDFSGWHWMDLLVAVKKASESHFGWIQGKTIHTFFGAKRPKEVEVIIDIQKGKKITETCFYGNFTAEVWEGANVNVGAGHLCATVKKRYSKEVKEYYNKIQEHLDKHSIFRGKSTRVTRRVSPWGEESLSLEIFELNTSDKIVLNSDAESVVQNFLIDYLGEEGKRCYLFSGGYGNGKTETAMRIGKEGIGKGMAFFYCKDAVMFHTLLEQAINYQPCIVFLEDVDEIAAGEQRDSKMNNILNTLDGATTKGNNLTVIFTTNHEKKINKALRRPGRIDTVVDFSNPTTKTKEKIYKVYLQELDTKGVLNYRELAEYTKDVPGAVVAESCKRASKLIERRKECTMEIVIAAIDSLAHHVKLMNEPVEQNQVGSMSITIENAAIAVENED